MKKKKNDYKPLELVLVIWIDAEEEGEIGWNDFKSIQKYSKKPCPKIQSVGHVVYHNDTHIALVSSLSEDRKNSSSCEKIPTAFIQEIIHLVPDKG
tara:strand:- start:417 stop:704 length:288 start_codon:yes stop_codon:yes gene_type:complete